ncbi:MAG: hypothetical protein V1725_07035 [archaeon]
MDDLALLHKEYARTFSTKNKPCPERLLRVWQREVAAELQRCTTLATFKKRGNVLMCRLLVRHNIEQLLLRHFARTYPKSTLLLETQKGTFAKIPGKNVRQYSSVMERVSAQLQRGHHA